MNALCEDCPPVDYGTDATRCAPCPRRCPTALPLIPIGGKMATPSFARSMLECGKQVAPEFLLPGETGAQAVARVAAWYQQSRQQADRA